jgi:type IV secretory pathway VirB4 component
MNTPWRRPRRPAAFGLRRLPGTPEAVEVHASSVRAGADHATTLAVVGYPSEVGPAWITPLLSWAGRLDVAIHIDPMPQAVAAERLRRQRGRLESSRRVDAGRGRLEDPEVEAAAEDAADLAHRIARGQERLFRVGVYLTVHAADEQELAERVAEVRALAASMLLEVVPVTWRQLQGWVSTLPLGVDALHCRRTFDTHALAAAFPFASPDIPADVIESGLAVLYGANLASAGVVCWDRWACDNHNSVILARSGAGKSYLAKLDLLRNLYLGVEAFVVDPEDEYLALATAVGGTVIRPGAPGVHLNPFDLSPHDPDALTRQALFIHTFLHVLLAGDTPTPQALSAEEAAAVDAAVLAAYESRGITSDARTWRRPPPLLADLAAALTRQGPAGVGLATRLRPYVTGSFSGLFTGPTSTPPSGHLVVFALRDLPEELKPVGTLLTLEAIWRRIRSDAGRTRRLVLVDEAWLMLRAGLGARFLLRLAKSARKYGAGLAVVTQDAADVLATDIGRAVVSNSSTQILLRQATQAIDAVTRAFGLTAGEAAFLTSAGQGDALLVAGSTRVAFHALASQAEHDLACSTPTFSQPDAAEGDPVW